MISSRKELGFNNPNFDGLMEIMTKESRLSFRIDEILSHKIDIMVDKTINIRDRSDFGTQAVQFYINVIENNETDITKILSAVNAIADKTGTNKLAEVKTMNKIAKKILPLLTKPSD